MTQDVDKDLPYQLIKQTVGIDIKVLSNEYKELPGYEGEGSSYQKIIFQVEEDDPDIYLPLGFFFVYPFYLSLSQRQEAILRKSLSLMRNMGWVIF
jgi:hypothetical protein